MNSEEGADNHSSKSDSTDMLRSKDPLYLTTMCDRIKKSYYH